MIDQPVRRCHSFRDYIRIVAVRQYAGFGELFWEQGLGPRRCPSVSGPSADAIPRQTMNEAYVDGGIGTVVQDFYPIRKHKLCWLFRRAGACQRLYTVGWCRFTVCFFLGINRKPAIDSRVDGCGVSSWLTRLLRYAKECESRWQVGKRKISEAAMRSCRFLVLIGTNMGKRRRGAGKDEH